MPSSPPPLHAPAVVPDDGRDRPRRGGAQRRASGSRSWSARAPGAPPTRSPQVADVLGAGVAKALLGKDVLTDELPFVTGVDRPARHPAQLRADARLRHAADRRLELPVQPVPAGVRAGPGRADRPRRRADRHALPDRGQPRRRRRARRCGRCCRCCPARRTARGARRSRTNVVALVGGRWSARRCWTPTRSTRCGSCGSSRSGCRTTRSSPPTPAPPPTGTPASCRCAATSAARCPGTLATMGAAVPYAIGAKFAHPDRPAIALVGDGAMQMNGMAELLTIASATPTAGRPAAGRRGAAQQRPQPGHVGAAGDGRRAEVRAVAGAARRLVRRLRARHRPAGDHRDVAGRARAGLGAGAGRRPARGARRPLRPRGAADPAARRRSTRPSR